VRHARAAVTHGGGDATALGIAAIALMHPGHDFEAASGAIARALTVNGSSATALYFGALVHAYSGDAALAEDYAVRALRLSPFDALAFAGHNAAGFVHIRNQRFDDAAANIAKAVQANPRFSSLYAHHAAALALAGRVEDAKSVAKRVLEPEPNFRVGPWEHIAPKFMLPELWRPLLAGLRQPGLPE
jgi:adenylate cyclase